MDGYARFGALEASSAVEVIDVATRPDALRTGVWFLVADFEGRARAWRFADVRRSPSRPPAAPGDPRAGAEERPGGLSTWHGPSAGSWTSSLDGPGYRAAVRAVRRHVLDGTVYQANICRVMSAPLAPAEDGEPCARALGDRLATGNPAPYEGLVHVPASSGLDPVWVVTASPELFLRVGPESAGGTAAGGALGTLLTSGPIKGTARTAGGLTAKDRAENVMITDLVRNDLHRVCAPGSVEVSNLLALEEHPGLVHLVSTVTGVLRPDLAAAPDRWTSILGATFPPASVSGAPKSSALRIISELEPVPRGPYCGAVGWIDGDAGTAELAVGIRTFWWTRESPDVPGGGPHLHFGTGAGITWGSDPDREWAETELKAHRLVALASAAH